MRDDRPGPLVIVYWEDIRGEAGWSESWQPKGHLANCVEVGWMTGRENGILTIVRGLAEPCDTADRHAGAALAIPLSVVRRIVHVDEPED